MNATTTTTDGLENPAGMVRRTLEITGLLHVLVTAARTDDR